MADERGISMSEFKTVVENFQSDLKKVVEVVLDLRAGLDAVKSDLGKHQQDTQQLRLEMKAGFLSVNDQFSMMKEQIGLLHEGQTETKNLLKQKVDQSEFANLEMRVTRLENKVA
jgi:hypothetical protein